MKKRTALRLFFMGELITFSWFYFCGSNGMQAIARIKDENSMLAKQILIAHEEVRALEIDVVAWQTNDFLKEKVAREQLQLAREGEEIYCV